MLEIVKQFDGSQAKTDDGLEMVLAKAVAVLKFLHCNVGKLDLERDAALRKKQKRKTPATVAAVETASARVVQAGRRWKEYADALEPVLEKLKKAVRRKEIPPMPTELLRRLDDPRYRPARGTGPVPDRSMHCRQL